MPKPLDALRVQGLSVRYGERLALDGIDFAIPRGAFLAVVGPNGSGKSTLLKSILGLVALGAGTIETASGEIGYVPQLKALDRTFPATVVEVVVSGMRKAWPWRVSAADRERALAALREVDVVRLGDEQISRLSGGELQRVYLARAMARRPRLILLDEPATGIDVASEAGLYNILERVRKDADATVVMVTHDLSVALHHATHVLLLSTVQIGFGPPSEALGEDALRRVFGHVGHKHRMGGGE